MVSITSDGTYHMGVLTGTVRGVPGRLFRHKGKRTKSSGQNEECKNGLQR